MYTEFWFCGILIGIAVALILRECYLFVRLKLDEWNRRVFARREMMLRLALEVFAPQTASFYGHDVSERFDLYIYIGAFGDRFVLQEHTQQQTHGGGVRQRFVGTLWAGLQFTGSPKQCGAWTPAQPLWRYILY
nr:uncharacterized protein LOC6625339 isoform X16 [Drosophila virilis]